MKSRIVLKRVASKIDSIIDFSGNSGLDEAVIEIIDNELRWGDLIIAIEKAGREFESTGFASERARDAWVKLQNLLIEIENGETGELEEGL